MGFCFSTKLLRALGWVPHHLETPPQIDGILLPSYGGLAANRLSVPPLTEAVDTAAVELYHSYGGRPVIVFAVPDFLPDDEELEAFLRTDFFVKRGVDSKKIAAAYGTHNTASEAQQNFAVLRAKNPSARNAIVCLNDLHIRRGLPMYQDAIGNLIKIYGKSVPCETYSNCRLPVWWRRLSIRCDAIYAWYMVATWIAWKLKVIK